MTGKSEGHRERATEAIRRAQRAVRPPAEEMPARSFEIGEDERRRIANWIDEKGFVKEDWAAAGGHLKYTFVPTGIGTVFKVTWTSLDGTETTLDLTDYENW